MSNYLFTVLACCVLNLQAGEFRLHEIFSDNMVVQRNEEIIVVGQASPEATVEIAIDASKTSVKADAAGTFKAVLAPIHKPGGPYTLLAKSGNKRIELKNILVGDVWLCAGQSNMEWDVRMAKNAKTEIASANYPDIRIMTLPKATEYEPQDQLQKAVKWRVCSPATIGWFSAVAYFFGRKLNTDLGVPIGLIDASWGGVGIEPYSSMEVLRSHEEFKPILERFARKRVLMNSAAIEKHKKLLQKYTVDKRKGLTPKKPEAPWGKEQYHPSTLFNGMIYPIKIFRIKGFIFYQGEANASRAVQYRQLQKELILSWRKLWNQGDLPFIITQIANYGGKSKPLIPESWAELREAQFMALELPATAMAVTCDIGEPKNIHPSNKQDVGWRLALAAEKIAYSKDVVFSGPVLEKIKFSEGRAELSFIHTGSGLTSKGVVLRHFQLAGSDGKYFDADAHIAGNKVIVTCTQVKDPKYVRYAWKNNPEGGHLYNMEGLPAVPFRTDSFPEKTLHRK